MEIGIRIKRLREKAKISQHELSAALGISQTKLCNIESSTDKGIDFILLYKVCRYFGIGFDYFLEANEKEGRSVYLYTHYKLEELIEDNKVKEQLIRELLLRIASLEKEQH